MSFGPSVTGSLNAFVDFAAAPFTSYVTNPLSGALDCGTQNLTNGGSASFSALATEQVSLPAGSLANKIPFSAPIEASLSRSGIATVLAGSAVVAVPAAGISDSSVIIAQCHLDTGAMMDATAQFVFNVEADVPANQFKINVNAAATADTKVAWCILKL